MLHLCCVCENEQLPSTLSQIPIRIASSFFSIQFQNVCLQMLQLNWSSHSFSFARPKSFRTEKTNACKTQPSIWSMFFYRRSQTFCSTYPRPFQLLCLVYLSFASFLFWLFSNCLCFLYYEWTIFNSNFKVFISLFFLCFTFHFTSTNFLNKLTLSSKLSFMLFILSSFLLLNCFVMCLYYKFMFQQFQFVTIERGS